MVSTSKFDGLYPVLVMMRLILMNLLEMKIKIFILNGLLDVLENMVLLNLLQTLKKQII